MTVRYARKRLDVSPVDLAVGLLDCLRPGGPVRAAQAVAARWPAPSEVVAALSARSAFDLWLAVVDWPPGTEIVFSAITIPHLPRLAREHGFVPVGVDVDPVTAAPGPASLDGAVGPRTRALVVAQLFGGRTDLGPLRAAADRHGLLLVDDRAQCYGGRPECRGPADLALYSFGTIKTATCAGGGVALVGDPVVAARMRARQLGWPRQSNRAHAVRLLRLAAMLAISTPVTYPVFWALAGRFGGDADRVVRAFSRGFDDVGLLDQIRRRPSPALLRLVARRLRRYDAGRVAARAVAGDRVAGALRASSTSASRPLHLGGGAGRHSHWLFPVLARDAAAAVALVDSARAAGFDATAGASVLAAVDPGCRRAADAMDRVVYLPVSAALPARQLDRLTRLVAGHVGATPPGGEEEDAAGGREPIRASGSS